MDNLVAQLTRLPGIGTRTAQRLAFHILRADDEDALALADAIRERLRAVLVVQTEVELVPFGSLGRSEYKSKLVER